MHVLVHSIDEKEKQKIETHLSQFEGFKKVPAPDGSNLPCYLVPDGSEEKLKDVPNIQFQP